jgi:hypothetical protein
MSTTKKRRVAGYVRVSTDRQADEGRVSLDFQEADIRTVSGRRKGPPLPIARLTVRSSHNT